MGFSDAAIVAATLLGPVFAVQAQKFLERRRETYLRRAQIFRTLIATRASRLSPVHVEALNLIDLEFYEPKRRFFKQRRSLARVRSAWKAYAAHLREPYPANQPVEPVFVNERNDLFADLLYEMASALHYDEYDKNECKQLSYVPLAHQDLEEEQNIIRSALAKVFSGSAAIPMHIVNFPSAPMSTEAPQDATRQLVPSSPR